MSKGARYETPVASGVNDTGKDAGQDGRLCSARRGARPCSSWSQNGSGGAGRVQTKSEWKTGRRRERCLRPAWAIRSGLEVLGESKAEFQVEFWPTERDSCTETANKI